MSGVNEKLYAAHRAAKTSDLRSIDKGAVHKQILPLITAVYRLVGELSTTLMVGTEKAYGTILVVASLYRMVHQHIPHAALGGPAVLGFASLRPEALRHHL